MTKKRITKLLVTLVCAIFVLPIALGAFVVKADANKTYAYVGVNFELVVTNEGIKDAGSDVKIELKETAGTPVVLYENGTIKTEGVTNAVLNSYTTGKVTLRITRAGDYVVSVETTKKDTAVSQSFDVKVLDDVNSEEFKQNFTEPSYKLSEIAAYRQIVKNSTVAEKVNPEDEDVLLSIGDEYKVPTLKDIVDTGAFGYSQYKRNLYYVVPHSSTYSTTNANGNTDLKINITKVGTYRFYVLFSLDSIDGKTFSITTKNTQEYADGFYKVKGDNGKYLFSSGSGDAIKFYKDEDLTEEYTGELTKAELVVPIFEFTIENAGPKITLPSYQEKGYINLKYNVKGIEVTGNDVDATYTLQYRENQTDEWQTASEEYDESKHSFTPTKEGYYRVKVDVIDVDGISESDATASIVVTKKLSKVEYKTSFKNWLSVNKVPFIFLCLSVVCLLAIVVLLLLTPKRMEAIANFFKKIFAKKENKVEDDDEE
ncbi:MAG: hypothetical protein E7358_00835 [Clostridiales bacterium]|nr:hypothetical protein [Clostridiales bacterium]